MYILIIAAMMSFLSLVRVYQEIVVYCMTGLIPFTDIDKRHFGAFNFNIIRNGWTRNFAKSRDFDKRLLDLLTNKFPEKLDKAGTAKMSKAGNIVELSGSFNDVHYHFRRIDSIKPWVEVTTSRWSLTKTPYIHPSINPSPTGNWVSIGDNYYVGGDVERFEDDIAIIALTHS